MNAVGNLKNQILNWFNKVTKGKIMKLGIATKNLKPIDNEDGTTSINLKDIVIIDLNTSEELEEKTGFLWCDKEFLLSGENPILTKEHFGDDPEDASYGVLIFRCDEAINI